MPPKLVQGTKKKKSDFFIQTKTALARGYLFLTGDRPSEATFRNLIESIPFFSQPEDRAKEEDGSSELKDLQGLVIAASDAQIKNRQAKSQNKTWSVQPSQVSEVAAPVDPVTVGSIDTSSGGGMAPFNGTLMSAVVDNTTTTHNKYLIGFTTDFVNFFTGLYNQVQGIFLDLNAFILSTSNQFTAISTYFTNTVNPRLLPTGGVAGQVLKKTSNVDGAASWQNEAQVLPVGGTTGQVLSKIDNANYNATWTTPFTLPNQATKAGWFLRTDATNPYWYQFSFDRQFSIANYGSPQVWPIAGQDATGTVMGEIITNPGPNRTYVLNITVEFARISTSPETVFCFYRDGSSLQEFKSVAIPTDSHTQTVTLQYMVFNVPPGAVFQARIKSDGNQVKVKRTYFSVDGIPVL